MPLLFTKMSNSGLDHSYGSDEGGRKEDQRNEKDYIQFHYGVGSEFYQLIPDPEMQYSCG